MLKRKKRNLWDKLSDIKYEDIPMVEHILDEKETMEFRYSKSTSIFVILIFLFMMIFWVSELVQSPDWIREKMMLSVLISGALVTALVVLVKSYFQNKIIIRLTNKGIQYKTKLYIWESIKNMCVRVQYNGDYYYHELLLESDEEENLIPLDSLDTEYELIVKEIGIFYWNWVIFAKDK